VEYDVPKIRDSLSTIEEEHHEQYDIPRNILKHNLHLEDLDDPIGHNSEENLYENQAYEINDNDDDDDGKNKQDNNIYANDGVITSTTFGEFSVTSSTHTDDRSSGYRSSSSPSIQSEELYVNESAIGSMEDSNPEHHLEDQKEVVQQQQQPPSSSHLSKEIGVGTTESLPKPRKSKKEKKEKEAKRDKERAQAEAIEQEIIFKKKQQQNSHSSSLEKPKSKAPKPPRTFFTDHVSVKVDVPKVSTEEKKKSFLQSLEKKPETNPVQQDNKKKDSKIKAEDKKFDTYDHHKIIKADKKATILEKKTSIEAVKKSTSDKGQPKAGTDTVEKKPSQKDRSVDVYHETVRQRATRGSSTTDTLKDVFPEPAQAVRKTTTLGGGSKKKRAPHHPQKDINDEDLPSVKHLMSKFESEKNSSSTSSSSSGSDSSPKKTKKTGGGGGSGKIDFKKGFNVMSSLTRRSAMSVSRSMQNLGNAAEQKKDSSAKKATTAAAATTASANDMDFGHYTYGSDEQPPAHAADFGKPASSSDELSMMNQPPEEALYVNVESTRTTLTKTKKLKPEPDHQHEQQHVHRSAAARNGAESSTANKLLISASMEDDEAINPGLGPWNPMKTVAHLYKLEQVPEESKDKNSRKDEDMEGFLERLPPGKKKSTIWNSWKKQFFVAKAGLLLIFGDSSRSVLMDRIELFGGRVDYMESTMLGVQDRRGHYVVLRCKDGEEADIWHTALATHVSHDLAQTFVNPMARNPELFKQILVVDFGGSSVRAGIASTVPTLPQLFFPSVMAIGKAHEDEKYFGMDAFAPEVRSRCNLIHPFAPSSSIDKYSINQVYNN
jgi:hypothetical protein